MTTESNVTLQNMTSSSDEGQYEGEPFHVFVVFGLVCILSTTAVIVFVVAIIQNRQRITNCCRKHDYYERRHSEVGRLKVPSTRRNKHRAYSSIEEQHPLHPVNSGQTTETLCRQSTLRKIDSMGSATDSDHHQQQQHQQLEHHLQQKFNGTSASGTPSPDIVTSTTATKSAATSTTTKASSAPPTANVAETPFIKHRNSSGRSRTSSCSVSFNISGSKQPTSCALKRQPLKTIHRSLTSAMLEQLGENSNSVLLLPLPYDHFTRDIIVILKTILTVEGEIPSQCCFDPDVHSDYTKDKFSWVEETLSDSNKIVIFVCLTTLPDKLVGDSLIYNLLSHCKISRYRPSCHVVFLHLTDNIKDLDNRYHGSDIHVKHENALESFFSAILQACGHDIELERAKLDHMLNCEASRHFFEKIGHSV